jgi:hypothetical protein
MFGNKYSGESIAREFGRLMNQSAIRKQAQAEESSDSPGLESQALENAEDFLVAPPDDGGERVSSELDNKILDLSNYSDDDADVCPKCEAKDCKCDECPKCKEGVCKCEPESEASDVLFDTRAAHTLHELGKMASNLRSRGESFAADMVEATANGIKEDLIKEVSKKAYVLDSLKKMATDFSREGDTLAADMVRVTINKIKNS